MLKHLALVEDDWIPAKVLGVDDPEPWASAPWNEDRDWDFHSAAHNSPESLRALNEAACARTRAVCAAHNLDDLSAIGDRESGELFSLRWILLHLIEETARHNGHADLLREAIDGQTGA